MTEPEPGEDIFRYIERTAGDFDLALYRRILGAANEWKEGDAAQGSRRPTTPRAVMPAPCSRAPASATSRPIPSSRTTVSRYIASAVDPAARQRIAGWTLGEWKEFLLTRSADEIAAVLPGVPSDVAAFTVKLLTNDELIAVGAKIFNPLPGSKIGAKGYLGARIQPNSPTDDVEDIVWQVFDGWSYAVGDVVLGCNPVSSDVESVAAIERALRRGDRRLRARAGHPAVRAVAHRRPGRGRAPLPGIDRDLVPEPRRRRRRQHHVRHLGRQDEGHAATRGGRYGLYFETGQGADGTNGHGKGFDMVIHEARKYGFARALRREVAAAQQRAGRPAAPWVHLNDVAGFIGPEVFRSREQLVRCCLEDTVMGKLHGLTIGLDVCSTLHMEVDLDDLDWCLDRIMPANPAYLMALPTKNDPMLSYLTTAFQDHVRIRERFGYRVDDRMWAFFQELGVIDADGRPTEHFGQPSWVYLQYRRRRRDTRPDAEILAEARRAIAARARARRRPRRRSRRAALGPRARARPPHPRPLRRLQAVHLGRAAGCVRRRAAGRGDGAHAVERPRRLHPPSSDRRAARRRAATPPSPSCATAGPTDGTCRS